MDYSSLFLCPMALEYTYFLQNTLRIWASTGSVLKKLDPCCPENFKKRSLPVFKNHSSTFQAI